MINRIVDFEKIKHVYYQLSELSSHKCFLPNLSTMMNKEKKVYCVVISAQFLLTKESTLTPPISMTSFALSIISLSYCQFHITI